MATVVTAHRMAFATSGTRTVLWDQIRYAGAPTEFSWVLPVKGDVRLEASTDAWFEALEAVTNARVSPPPLHCYQLIDRGGCSCGGDDSSTLAPSAGGVPRDAINGVVVTHEGSVGPYQYVQVEGGGQALAQWLPENGYAVPADVVPMLTAYATEGFGFIALKLQPGLQTKQMTPVRVVTEGGLGTLPLRMVAAGTGDFVAITLYVIAEGRYDVDGFGQAKLDTSKLTWDWRTSQSNYADVRKLALDAEGGKVWLTAFAERQAFTRSYNDALGQPISFTVNSQSVPVQFGQGFSDLTDLYFAEAQANANKMDACATQGIAGALQTSLPVYDDCKGSGTTLVTDAGVPAADAGAPTMPCDPAPTGTVAASSFACGGFTDIAAAMIGMHPDTVWLTRLEANLPHAALATDLKIKPAASQDPGLHAFRAAVHVNPPCDLLENHTEVELPRRRNQEAGVGFLAGIGLLLARRARRKA